MVTKILPLGLLSALIAKSIITGSGLPEMLVATALVGLLSLREYLEKQKAIHEVKAMMEKELAEMKAIVKTQNEVIEKVTKKCVEQETAISGIRLSTGMQTRVGRTG